MPIRAKREICNSNLNIKRLIFKLNEMNAVISALKIKKKDEH